MAWKELKQGTTDLICAKTCKAGIQPQGPLSVLKMRKPDRDKRDAGEN
jgi:hypothetical protein